MSSSKSLCLTDAFDLRILSNILTAGWRLAAAGLHCALVAAVIVVPLYDCGKVKLWFYKGFAVPSMCWCTEDLLVLFQLKLSETLAVVWGKRISILCSITCIFSEFSGWHVRCLESWHFQNSTVIFNMFNWQFLKPLEGHLINLLCSVTDNWNPLFFFLSYQLPQALVKAVSGFKVSNFLSQTSLVRFIIPKRVLSKAIGSLIATVSFFQYLSPCLMCKCSCGCSVIA